MNAEAVVCWVLVLAPVLQLGLAEVPMHPSVPAVPVVGLSARWSRDLALVGVLVPLTPFLFFPFGSGPLVWAAICGALGGMLGGLVPRALDWGRLRGLSPVYAVAALTLGGYWWGFLTSVVHRMLLGSHVHPVTLGAALGALCALLAGPYLLATVLRLPTLPVVAGSVFSAAALQGVCVWWLM